MEDLKQFRNTHIFAAYNGELFSKLKMEWFEKSLTKQGYYRIHPRIKGKKHNFFVARVVAECWIPNPENKPFVLHRDNNPLNNAVPNLRWGTQSENIQQAYDDNRITAKGQNNGQAKLTDIQVQVIREARKSGYQNRKIARYFKMSESWIAQVANGNRWSHL